VSTPTNVSHNSTMEIAAGVARRDLPLFSCSYISRTLRGIVEAVEVLTTTPCRRSLCLLFSAVCWWGAQVGATPVVVVVAVAFGGAAGAVWGPSAVQIAMRMVE
jgi:hypothetical protein